MIQASAVGRQVTFAVSEVWLIGDSKLVIGLNAGVNGCVSL